MFFLCLPQKIESSHSLEAELVKKQSERNLCSPNLFLEILILDILAGFVQITLNHGHIRVKIRHSFFADAVNGFASFARVRFGSQEGFGDLEEWLIFLIPWTQFQVFAQGGELEFLHHVIVDSFGFVNRFFALQNLH